MSSPEDRPGLDPETDDASVADAGEPDGSTDTRDVTRAAGVGPRPEELDARDMAGERAIFGGLRDFREHLGGELTVTFPLGLCARHEVHEIDLPGMEAALASLHQLTTHPSLTDTR